MYQIPNIEHILEQDSYLNYDIAVGLVWFCLVHFVKCLALLMLCPGIDVVMFYIADVRPGICFSALTPWYCLGNALVLAWYCLCNPLVLLWY